MKHALFALFFLAAVPAPGRAQVDSAQAAFPVQALAREINWRKLVRVSIDAGRVELERPRLEPDGLFYRDAVWIVTPETGTPDIALPLPLDVIERIEVRKGHPLEGLAIGFGVGALAGLAIAEAEGDGDPRGAIVVPFGALGGALVGFIIGESRVTWRPVYRRPNERMGPR